MTEDSRCCGSGTCIINAEGLCWCGQQWDGEKMCHVPLAESQSLSGANAQAAITPTSPLTATNTPDGH
jgi:hypothetical protein